MSSNSSPRFATEEEAQHALDMLWDEVLEVAPHLEPFMQPLIFNNNYDPERPPQATPFEYWIGLYPRTKEQSGALQLPHSCVTIFTSIERFQELMGLAVVMAAPQVLRDVKEIIAGELLNATSPRIFQTVVTH
jgi:hypothetical protein